MGWNPEFKFSLRDDQISFGKLIIDKNFSEILSEVLIALRDGGNVDMNNLRDKLNAYCFTSEEFENVRDDYEYVKEDIRFFNSILGSVYHIVSFNRWVERTNMRINYVAGSVTWLEKYRETKLLAGELYQRLVELKYDFREHASTYAERYGDVIKLSTPEERIGTMLQSNYAEEVAAGNPDALKNYINSMKKHGLWTEEQAKANELLFGAGEAASHFSKAVETPEHIQRRTEEVREKREHPVEEVKEMDYDYETFLEMKEKLDNHMQTDSEKYLSLLELLLDSIETVGLTARNEWKEVLNSRQGSRAKSTVSEVMNFLGFNVNKSLINAYPLKYSTSLYDSIVGADSTGNKSPNLPKIALRKNKNGVIIEHISIIQLIDTVIQSYNNGNAIPKSTVGTIIQVACDLLKENEILINNKWYEHSQILIMESGRICDYDLNVLRQVAECLTYGANSRILNGKYTYCAPFLVSKYLCDLVTINEILGEPVDPREVLIDSETIRDARGKLSQTTDAMKRALKTVTLIGIVTDIYKKANVPLSPAWNKVLDDFSKGTGTAGQVLNVFDEIVEMLDVTNISNAVDRLRYTYDRDTFERIVSVDSYTKDKDSITVSAYVIHACASRIRNEEDALQKSKKTMRLVSIMQDIFNECGIEMSDEWSHVIDKYKAGNATAGMLFAVMERMVNCALSNKEIVDRVEFQYDKISWEHSF